ncbi:hypothetical protein B0H14DRAFT_3479956 [Mycena olivaceomarginata]|nr:hypothetical protein B0H14DRAFT_3479956 [Mycena olivaceomarginata]
MGLSEHIFYVLLDGAGLRMNPDLEDPVEDAKIHWKKAFPLHVESQMVEFQAHDFFTSQPVKNATVFLLCYIMHNWPTRPPPRSSRTCAPPHSLSCVKI